ncbi:Translation initiation factor eIF-2B subunit like protein [Argiope bruennichi]|uniref:Translation initiation factor eIF2B subunit delta n=1 Tax=Argiope bruennichi TaxID=94029 RepID=A0A8T0EGH7_ARGBR|nr:Translation initiation factor eIF-2B subunit like protein [Argiope bruennichi]
MSEPEVKKKNKKKKKKSGKKPVVEETLPPPPPPENKISQNEPENGAVSINEVLPNKVGMTTKFNDVEVTMTHDGVVNNIDTSASSKKKKKKKKKSKQATTEVVEEPKITEDNSQTNFFKFDKDRIELVNHPEISVTLSKAVPIKEKEPQESEKENFPAVDKKDQEPETAVNSTSKKKKKKKKKKKTTVDSNLPSEEPNPESVDASYKAPTYVKLPATGDSCVLVVSHEGFANDNKAPVNSEAVSTVNSNSTVLIRNKDRIEESKGVTLSAPKIQTEPSISIFPVSSDQNKTSSDKTSSMTMEPNLQKVNQLIKKEVNSNDPAGQTKDGPVNSEGPTLTKAQLKAERRAKQEAQRAAKLAKSNEKNVSHPEGAAQKKTPVENSKPAPQVKQNINTENTEAAKSKSTSKSTPEKVTNRGSQIFSHLPQVKDLTAKQMSDANLKIHPAIIELGVHFNKGTICGSNARCVGFLGAFREAIQDYEKPPDKEFSRDLESKLKMYLNFLNNCRPLSVSITNAVRFLQHQINRIPKDSSDQEVKQKLYNSINNFVKEEILLAKEAICMSATAKIVDGDNIVVYAYSSIVKDVLCKAHDQNKSFHVTVIDSGPKFEGLQMLHLLSKYGLQCAYKSIDSVCSVMKKASKVFIGAHALLLNGYVMSRLGCKQLALVASSYSVPVLVCCETYKFCDRSLSDSFVHNELGKPEDLIKTCLNKKESLEDWQSLPSFQTCNILYDVTPSDLISVIITEKGLLPCSSVPVVLRVKYASLQE